MRTPLVTVTLPPPRAAAKRHGHPVFRSRLADARDFALVALFVSAFLSASYLALWKPLLRLLS